MIHIVFHTSRSFAWTPPNWADGLDIRIALSNMCPAPATVYLNRWQMRDIIRWCRDDMDHETQMAVMRGERIETIWGANLVITDPIL